ncbi:MAG: LysR family transcriptional regulator [Arenicella sp.]
MPKHHLSVKRNIMYNKCNFFEFTKTMNLSNLHTFLAIAETGSLVKASERLFVSQSTVTSRLQSLEADVGQTLFHRKKSGVTLTVAGQKLKRYAEAMTDLWRQARQETSLPDGVSSVCNLGCHYDLWPKVGRRIMDKLHQSYPSTALSAYPGHHDQLDQWMATGLINAALTYRPTAQENQTIHTLNNEQLVLVGSRPDNPMRFDPGYIYVDAGADFGRRHAAAYTDAGIAKVSFGSAVWALDYLLDHGGSAYLPEQLAEPHITSGVLYLISEAPIFNRTAYLITNDLAANQWEWLSDITELIQETTVS